ncbi:12936_t:CDS:2, partial [Racocetra fulgida]
QYNNSEVTSLVNLETTLSSNLEATLSSNLEATSSSNLEAAASSNLERTSSANKNIKKASTYKYKLMSTKQVSKSPKPAKVIRKNHKKIPITEFVESLTAVTPDPDDSLISINIMEGDTENSVGKNLAILFKDACEAEKQLIASGIANNPARNQIYKEILTFISGITENNLKQKKHKAR